VHCRRRIRVDGPACPSFRRTLAGGIGRAWFAVALLTLASRAAAQLTMSGASILLVPHVVADGTRDTVVHIANISNSMVLAHCFYVNGSVCLMNDFSIALTQQQPTHWLASQGRPLNATDPRCSPTNSACDGAGTDPGSIPPLPADFRGELLCVQVDLSGAPVAGNSLIGTVTLINRLAPDVAKYNAIGLRGYNTGNGDAVLCLGGGVSAQCPNGAEYDGCPASWSLNHAADGSQDELAGPGSAVNTTLIAQPCTMNLETQAPTTINLAFSITNELEQTFSAATTVSCWAAMPLSAIDPAFTFANLGTASARTTITSTGGGVALVAEETRSALSGAVSTTEADSLHYMGTQADVITIPATP
jgi:hypothetical protein